MIAKIETTEGESRTRSPIPTTQGQTPTRTLCERWLGEIVETTPHDSLRKISKMHLRKVSFDSLDPNSENHSPIQVTNVRDKTDRSQRDRPHQLPNLLQREQRCLFNLCQKVRESSSISETQNSEFSKPNLEKSRFLVFHCQNPNCERNSTPTQSSKPE